MNLRTLLKAPHEVRQGLWRALSRSQRLQINREAVKQGVDIRQEGLILGGRHENN